MTWLVIYIETVVAPLWKRTWERARVESKRLIVRLLENLGRDEESEQHWNQRPWVHGSSPQSCSGSSFVRAAPGAGKDRSQSADRPGGVRDRTRDWTTNCSGTQTHKSRVDNRGSHCKPQTFPPGQQWSLMWP